MASTTQNTKITNQTVEAPPPETMVRFSIREEEEEEDWVSTRHKRRRIPLSSLTFRSIFGKALEDDDVSTSHRFSSSASGSQPRPNEDEDEDEDDDDDDDDLEFIDESESDDDVIEEVTDVRRTCTASRWLPVVGDVAVRSTVEKNVVVTEVVNNASGALSAVFTDPDVLDCPICLEALCVPVYQDKLNMPLKLIRIIKAVTPNKHSTGRGLPLSPLVSNGKVLFISRRRLNFSFVFGPTGSSVFGAASLFKRTL
ncbi:hypothetical protein Tco_1317128 [Tanacetum coccineum]